MAFVTFPDPFILGSIGTCKGVLGFDASHGTFENAAAKLSSAACFEDLEMVSLFDAQCCCFLPVVAVIFTEQNVSFCPSLLLKKSVKIVFRINTIHSLPFSVSSRES